MRNYPKKKRKLRKGWLMDLLLLIVLMTAPVWATILYYANPFSGAGKLLNLPLVIVGVQGAMIDIALFAMRFVGEEWW